MTGRGRRVNKDPDGMAQDSVGEKVDSSTGRFGQFPNAIRDLGETVETLKSGSINSERKGDHVCR